MKVFPFLFVAICFGLCDARCPGAIEMSENKQTCAILYQHDDCTGEKFAIKIGDVDPKITESSDDFGLTAFGFSLSFSDRATAAQVRPGCELTAHQHKNFNGIKQKWSYKEGGYKNLRDYDLNDKISSYLCFCEEWVNCSPEDKVLPLYECSAAKSLTTPVECSYSYQEGTEHIASETNGQSFGITTSASIEVTLKNMFKTSAKISTEWKTWQEKTTTDVFSKSTTHTIKVIAQPGQTIRISQRMAICDSYHIRGQVYKAILGAEINRARRYK